MYAFTYKTKNYACYKKKKYMNGWIRIRFSGRNRMVVGFTTSYAISSYHHCCCKFESRSWRGVQHYMIMFASDLRQVGGFLWVLRFPPSIKLNAKHDIAEILLKVALSTIKQTKQQTNVYFCLTQMMPGVIEPSAQKPSIGTKERICRANGYIACAIMKREFKQ